MLRRGLVLYQDVNWENSLYFNLNTKFYYLLDKLFKTRLNKTLVEFGLAMIIIACFKSI